MLILTQWRKKLLENIVEKGEIAHLSNFTFFHNVFLKLFFFTVLKRVYMERGGLTTKEVVANIVDQDQIALYVQYGPWSTLSTFLY